jgi:hypothetical protein
MSSRTPDLCPVGPTTSATGRDGRHSAALTDTSMSACATSSPDGISPDGAPRRHPPSIGEIKYFCDTVILDSDPKPLIAPFPKPEPPRGPASVEDKARVAAKLQQTLAFLGRGTGSAWRAPKAKDVEKDKAEAALGAAQREAEAQLASATEQPPRIEISESLKRNLAARPDEQPPGDC